MYATKPIVGAALLCSLASAVPNIRPRETDSALEPWVTVNEDGTPSTVTPISTTISGTPTIISGAPHDLTATVFTETSYGKVSISTGTAPMATATGGDAGSLPVCHNKDGDNAPWCQPSDGTPLYSGTTYYFTWDSSYFTVANTTILVQGNYLNETTGEITDQAFESPKWSASWGFWSYKVEDSLLKHQSAKNITLQLATLTTNGNSSTIMKGPRVLITQVPGPQPDTGKSIDKLALAIALPIALAFVGIVVIGTCIWNKKARQIDIANLMSRKRGYGVGKSSRSRMAFGKKNKANERIQLMEREVVENGGEVYRDEPDRPRRDSDALGSLAGTPTEERRMDFYGPGARDQRDRSQTSRNVF